MGDTTTGTEPEGREFFSSRQESGRLIGVFLNPAELSAA